MGQTGGYTAAWSERRIRWPLVESEHVARLRTEHELFTGRPGAGSGFAVVGPSEAAIEA